MKCYKVFSPAASSFRLISVCLRFGVFSDCTFLDNFTVWFIIYREVLFLYDSVLKAKGGSDNDTDMQYHS